MDGRKTEKKKRILKEAVVVYPVVILESLGKTTKTLG
jgi:hypothetical protein